MNRAVTDTNATLNLAISPSLWLLPSDLVILETLIPGYNNRLKFATEGMTIGVNSKVNYSEPKGINPPKKVHQEQGQHFQSHRTPTPKVPTPRAPKVPKVLTQKAPKSDTSEGMGELLVIAAVLGYLVTKHAV